MRLSPAGVKDFSAQVGAAHGLFAMREKRPEQ